ncbi:MAG: hypothetical protein JWP10_1487 [Nocardioidaceae bacterium]|nr:hypothetical protein [Nocardioidaceae bacterium]
MIRKRISLAVAGALTVGTAVTMGLAGPVAAVDNVSDPTFTSAAGDIVGVGSDTSQFALHNIADVYNVGKSTGRIASFAADGTPATISLKGGTAITRPNGSGAGKALLYGAANNTDVDFARSSSSLNPTEISANLFQAPFAVDGLKLAVSSTATNAPATVTAVDAVKIYDGTYDNWNDLPGSTTSGVIKPLIPQPGSGTRSFFEAQLKATNGGVAVTLAGTVTNTQEHSDADIKNDPNAIAPYSTGRAKTTPTIKLLDGMSYIRALYNVFRSTDLSSKPTLVSIFGEDGFVCSAAAKPLIEAAGFDQLATTARGGQCGEFVQNVVTNFKTSNEAADDTTTTLAASQANGRKVTLAARVTSLVNSPVGLVKFTEGATQVGQVAVAGGKATLVLSNASVGAHTYKASFVPSDATAFKTSASANSSVTVKQSSAIDITTKSSTFGKAGKVTVAVTANGAAAAGTVSIKIGTSAARSVALSGGRASVAVSKSQAAGNIPVVATWAGTSAVNASTVTATLTISKAKTKTTLKISDTKIKTSQKGKATVKIKITGAASGVYAKGKITLKVGDTVVGTGTLKKGKATITLKKLAKGTYKVKAIYGGNGNVFGSKSSAVTLKVTK